MEKDWSRVGATALCFIVFAAASIAGFALLEIKDAAFGSLLAAMALFIAAVDIDRFEIPDVGCLAILVLGFAWTAQTSRLNSQALLEAVLRVVFAAGFLFVMRSAYRLVRHTDGLGLGDVKLAGAGASWLSWPNIPLTFLIAAVAAIIVVIVRSLLLDRKVQVSAAIPFGAFLAPAIWVVWLVQVLAPAD